MTDDASSVRGAFLTAQWRWLVMLNFEIDPGLLRPLVPAGTELDECNGVTYASVVGFIFLRTRVFGLGIPGYRDFEELNLRFYVRRKAPDGWRRGVVFVKELVPRAITAAVARLFFNENYIALPMRHRLDLQPGAGGSIEYGWKIAGRWAALRAEVGGDPQPVEDDSEEAFITEHYWGYVRHRNGGTLEYGVEHPRWRVWRPHVTALDGDLVALYGSALAEPLAVPARSALVAEGSDVTVRRRRRVV